MKIIIILCFLFGISLIDLSNGQRIQYDFALQFISNPVGNVNHATATSQSITTTIGDAGPTATVTLLQPAQKALWLSETTGSIGNRWKEVGNITFAGAGTILFASNDYSGIQMGNFPDLNYGAITYQINGGTGSFLGAYGMMVDMFISTDPNNATAPFAIQAAGHFWVNS